MKLISTLQGHFIPEESEITFFWPRRTPTEKNGDPTHFGFNKNEISVPKEGHVSVAVGYKWLPISLINLTMVNLTSLTHVYMYLRTFFLFKPPLPPLSLWLHFLLLLLSMHNNVDFVCV
ncbi:hypothetical protein RJT34_15859 [Clitoria ternatea]|uniref:Uncharacterized protein n=1 Tax=Clitoria ternatea TaxID=43366 RepID=A0AAN9PD65_CLITE